MEYRVHGILQVTILEWVAFPFSRGSFQPRDQAQVSCIAGRFKLSHKGSPPKAKLAPKKKVSVTVWWSAACLYHYSFLYPKETIISEKYAQQIDEMTAAATIGQQKGPSSSPGRYPTTRCTTNASKVEWIGLWSFASSTIFTWPLANWLPLLQASQQLFAGKCLHK